jgi:ribonuclease Y
MEIIISFLVGAALVGLISYLYIRPKAILKEAEVKAQQQKLLEHAEKKAAQIEIAAREKSEKLQEKAMDASRELKQEERDMRDKYEKLQVKLIEKEEGLQKRVMQMEQKFEEVSKREDELRLKDENLAKMIQDEMLELERISGLKKEDARNLFLQKIETDAREDAVVLLRKLEEETKEEALKKSRKIITMAIQKYASEVASESTSTVVNLPSDDMKGRIIGKEGRNINTFEKLTGVDVIVDDTPGSIVISGFDLLRRYIAKIALERLVEDGRIHPAKIEEEIEKSRKETAELIKECGEKAVFEMGFTGIHPNLIKIIGRLRFRTSYGQNILKHSIEVGYLASALASEIGVDPEIAKKCGFFHDIGKAVDHEIEGPHALIGRDILEKFKFDPVVVHAVAAHHEDVPPDENIYAYIVMAADAISGARPGARSETLESYIKRLKELEETANSFDGVKKCYAIQAGRDLRVFVDPEVTDDLKTIQLAKDIAKKIETDLDYPGVIKVNVFREKRITELAK